MAQERVIQVPVTFDRYARKKDRSLTLAFTTNVEMSNNELAIIDDLWQTEGHLLFKKNQFSDSEIPEVNVPSKQKSPSQELKSSLYARWATLRERGDERADLEWDEYYKRAIRYYKQEIDSSY